MGEQGLDAPLIPLAACVAVQLEEDLAHVGGVGVTVVGSVDLQLRRVPRLPGAAP